MTLVRVVWLLFCCGQLIFTPVSAAEPMLPQVYRGQVDVAGWLMSEKLDGVRAHWDGEQLLSKNGNRFYPPPEFLRGLPAFPLEGELWGGRGSFEQTVGIVTQQQPHAGWLQIRFAIFDAPDVPGTFRERLEQARRWFSAQPAVHAFVIPQIQIRDSQHLHQELWRVERSGGEGLIVRRPDALYVAGRSAEILKVKSYQDAEARVVAHLPGKGRNAGRLGALLVENEDGLQFRLGSGFSDLERETPPPVGSFITFKHYGKYQSGVPKFPAYLRVRRDRELSF